LCLLSIGVLLFVAYAACVLGGRDDERAGRDL